jgi:hypothetical protein
LDERARRIQAAKEAAAKARREQIRKEREQWEAIKNFLIVMGVILAMGFLLVGMLWTIARG